MLRPPQDATPLDRVVVRRIVVGVLLAMLLAALDQTIVATALPTIADRLHDTDNLSWVVTAYLLSATAVTPLYGKLSDIHGRRTMILIGIAVFTAGSVVCALAPTMLALIMGRVLQGLGGGGLMPLTQAVIGDVAPPHERARYQAMSATVFMVATVSGPLLGGLITQYLHWSLIFWINLPLGAVVFAMSYDALRRLPRHDRSHALDILGAALMVGAAVLLMLAVTWGGHRYPWGSPQIIGALLCSLALWALFFLRQVTTIEPFIPLSVLYDRVVRNVTGSAFFGNGTTVALTIYVALYFQLALGISASLSGIAVVAFQGGATTAAMLAGRAMAHTTHHKRIAVGGLLLAIVTLGILAMLPTTLPLAVTIALIALVGCGVGPSFPTTIVAMQNAVPSHQLGIASGLLSFSRSLGGSLIVTAFGAIVLAGAGFAVPLDQVATRGAVLDGSVFRWVFAAAAIGFAAALCCLLAIDECSMGGSAPVAPD